MKIQPYISIVSPVYKAENIINKLYNEIVIHVSEITDSFEIILVEDGSPDNSWECIEAICKKDKRVKGIKLSRNFGQHPAIMAGLIKATGEWIVVMDCDLQDQPKEVKKLYKKTKEGFDAVLARRKKRKDTFFKKLSSKLYSLFFSFLTDTKYDNEIANFGIYNTKVVKAILSIDDYIKFLPLFVNFVGFKQCSVVVEHASRDSGKSSYSFLKLLSLAFNTIISFSNKPLKLFVKFGAFMSLASFIVGLYYLYLYSIDKIEVIGFTSLMISIWFLTGILLTSIGICGIYIGKIFDQSKNRPNYIIDKII